jgi:Ca-activated chloride channel homolog
MYKLIATLLLPISVALYWATTATHWTGKVTYQSGQPLAQAELIFSNGDTSISVITNDKGYYSTHLPKGSYHLLIYHEDKLVRNTPSITVGTRNRTLNFVIKPGEPVFVPPVIKKDEELQEEEPTINEQPTVEYRVPLIKEDQTSGGQTLTSESIQVLRKRAPSDGKEARFQHDLNPDIRYDAVAAPAPQKTTSQNANSEKPRKEIVEDRKKISGNTNNNTTPDSTPTRYNPIVENPFEQATKQPFSTFSIDVDAAAYANVRRLAPYGPVPPDAVRIEEMVNYFDYSYPQPTGNDPIRIETELGKCPWNPEHHLLMVGLQGRDMPKANIPPGNFVFLVDVSGSMNGPDRLPLVKQSLYLLLDELRPTDRVALVTYAGSTAVTLPSTPASDKATIKAAIEQLGAGGSTAGASGIQLAYQTARAHFNQQGNNRVILCTDGDFNVGVSSQEELVKMIEKERESGIYLTVLGYGRGNYQDGTMQELADRGNGNHAYIDRLDEAHKVLVKEFGGTLYTIAKDVKLQLVFNPDQVLEYRLIGYENRILAKEDFNNDKKDAGELGAGHTVTALYEIVPNPKGKPGPLVDLKFRYKPPTGNQASLLVEKSVPAICAVLPSENFMFAASVAECGLLLRHSTHKGTSNWSQVLTYAKNGLGPDANGYRKEFLGLVEQHFSKN